MFLTQIVQNEVTELTLCERCAKERGLFDPQTLTFAEKFFPSMIQEKVADLIQQLSSNKTGEQQAFAPTTDVLTRCPVCGFQITDYYKTERLGCPHCYQVFAEDFTPELKKALALSAAEEEETTESLHDAGSPPAASLRELELELKRAVALENYELAASLRDRIKALS